MTAVCLIMQEYLASRAWQRVPAALAVETTLPRQILCLLTRESRAQRIMFPGIDISTYRRTKGHCLRSRNYRKKALKASRQTVSISFIAVL